jgi:hypothetical protein
MSTRGKVWLGMIASCIVIWGLIIGALVRADEKPAMKVVSWVHIWGCPRPASDVVLLVQDGTAMRFVHIKIDILSDMEKAKLKEMIGDVEGINIQYKCGNEI